MRADPFSHGGKGAGTGGEKGTSQEFAADTNSPSDASNDVRMPQNPAQSGRGGFIRSVGKAVGVIWNLPNTVVGAAGDDYFDYGPQPFEGEKLSGSPGRSWWDAMVPSGDASRTKISQLITSEGKTVQRFSRDVPISQAVKVRSYWQNLYKNPGTYHFAGQQCTTCVANSLRGAGITDFWVWKPTTLGTHLRALGWNEQ